MLPLKKIAYYLLLTATVSTIAILAGMAVWCCVYRQFFYIPPTGPVLPESAGPDTGSGLLLFAAAFAGFAGSGILYCFNSDGQQDWIAGAGK